MPRGYKNRITIDPNVMVGKPVIAGTRVPVYLVFRKLAQGMKTDEILRDYPRLTEEDVRAAIWYGAEAIAGEEVYAWG